MREARSWDLGQRLSLATEVPKPRGSGQVWAGTLVNAECPQGL